MKSPAQERGGVKTRCGQDFGHNSWKILAKLTNFLEKCLKTADFNYQADIKFKFWKNYKKEGKILGNVKLSWKFLHNVYVFYKLFSTDLGDFDHAWIL